MILDRAIMQYINQCFGLMVSEETVTDIKHAIGTAVIPVEDCEYSFSGRDMTSGIVRRSVVHQSEIYQVINNGLEKLFRCYTTMIRVTAPEFSG